MPSLANLVSALDERQLAQRLGRHHDEARLSYRLYANTVADVREFERVIGDYYNHHQAVCVTSGGRLPMHEAVRRAKAILADSARRHHLTLNNVVANAIDGTNGGMRSILDDICEALKAEAIENFIMEVIDYEIEFNDWPQKVAVTRQLMSLFGDHLPAELKHEPAERFAHDYRELIRSVVDQMRSTSSLFRKL